MTDGAHRIAFFGTPEVAGTALAALVADPDLDVVAVVTNPDRPRGRSRKPQPPAVKILAAEYGLTVFQPEKPAQIAEELHELRLDACAIVAYGAILPTSVLEAGGAGFVNLHFSLLPRWRGAAPVQHAIRAGDAVTGVTTFALDEGMDTGPILAQEQVPIGPDETAGSLVGRLAAVGAPLLVRSVKDLIGGATPEPQEEDGVTYAPRITPDDVEIDWAAPATDIVNLVRSANPAPGAFTTLAGQRLKIWRASRAELIGTSGTVIDAGRHGIAVAAGEGAVRLDEVQPAGRSRMDGAAFANGRPVDVGHSLVG